MRAQAKSRFQVRGALLAMLGVLWLAAPAGAVPPVPENLQVAGGEETWHTDTSFRLDWLGSSPWAPPSTLVAFRYRVLGPGGETVVGETRVGPYPSAIPITVPNIPGAYKAQIWFEDQWGSQGPPATARLQFDDKPPANVKPLPRAGWISRTEDPYAIQIEPPQGHPPVSGIRGYALSVDRNPTANPCEGPDRCSLAETDVQGGAAGNAVPVSDLPEGTIYAHAVAVSGSGMRSVTPGHTALRVDKTDPVVRIAGVPSGWTNRSVSLFATATDELSGMRSTGTSDGPFTAIRINDSAPVVATGDTVHASVIEPGVHTISYYARDAAGNVNDGGHMNGHRNHPPAKATVRIDREPPQVAFLNLENPEEPELIEARVSDPLAGPSRSRGEIAVRPAGSDGPFEALPMVEAGESLRAHWDSDAYAPGLYEFRATAFDAAGNSASTKVRANGSNMHLSNPLKIGTSLSAGFGGKAMVWHRCTKRAGRTRCRRETIGERERRPVQHLVGHDRTTVFSGRLIAGARAPLAGAEVLVVERFDSGSGQREKVTPVSTGADGGFVARLGPGPSREVTAVFEGKPTLARAVSERLRLEARSGVRLRASAASAVIGGRPIVFHGQVLAGDKMTPVDGRTVQLQFRVPGIPWTEFRAVQTDARGRFRYPYGFSDDDSRGVRFQFRAYIPEQQGWPYEPGGSLPVTVRGR